jgi:hypothetical protein
MILNSPLYPLAPAHEKATVPASMCQQDLDLLKMQIDHYLKILKVTSVAPAEKSEPTSA